VGLKAKTGKMGVKMKKITTRTTQKIELMATHWMALGNFSLWQGESILLFTK